MYECTISKRIVLDYLKLHEFLQICRLNIVCKLILFVNISIYIQEQYGWIEKKQSLQNHQISQNKTERKKKWTNKEKLI